MKQFTEDAKQILKDDLNEDIDNQETKMRSLALKLSEKRRYLDNLLSQRAAPVGLHITDIILLTFFNDRFWSHLFPRLFLKQWLKSDWDFLILSRTALKH